jgi:S-DNA-T family DNA segregation ATPase FtsK/SpoIIIE
VSRRLADKRDLGLHPLVCAIDECHELFQHPRFGKAAADLAVRVIKRGRKYGVVLLLATQSPTKDSLPREVTRNVGCGVAYSVADQVANDGLLGSGRYAAGVRATELRMHTDRGTFEDGADDVTPVIERAMQLLAEAGRTITDDARPALEAAPTDHLADVFEVMRGERRVRTQVVLARLAELSPSEYEEWTFSTLTSVLGEYGIAPRKSDGVKVVRAEDVEAALAERHTGTSGRDDDHRQGVLPTTSLRVRPSLDLRKPSPGRRSMGDAISGRKGLLAGDDSTGRASLPGGGSDDE